VSKYLHIDFETKSLLDLPEVGLDRYAKHSSTRALMLAWAEDDAPVQLWRPDKEPIPPKLKKLLSDHSVKKVAWYASFEHEIFKDVLGIDIPWEQWIDPSVYAKHLSLPGSLEECGEILGLNPDEAKIKDGKRLIRLFSIPFTMGGTITLFGVEPPGFHDEHSHPADWKLFEQYCMRDVETERTIFKMMQPTPLPESEQKLWVLDQKINERGVPTNRQFAQNVLNLALKYRDEKVAILKEKTGLENPNSNDQILEWLKPRGYTLGAMKKPYVEKALAEDKITPEAREVLELRQNTSKTSYTKLETLLNMLSDDDRLRWQFSFLGASRSGRWSGSGVQLQNLPRPIKWTEKHLELAIKMAEAFDYYGLLAELNKEKKPPSVISVSTSLIRSCFQVPVGKKLVVCDLNAIENRVLGWVTGCDAILKVFRDKLDPYLAFASLMYQIPYEDLYARFKAGDSEAKEMRQVAKSAVLGAGYGLGSGVDRFCSKCKIKLEFRQDCCSKHRHASINYTAATKIEKKTGNILHTGLMAYAENMGINLTPEQAYKAWKSFRESYPEVVQGWSDLEKAAIEVLREGGSVQAGFVTFDRLVKKDGKFILRIKLPSGRYLHYINARLEVEIKKSAKGREYEQVKIKYSGIGHGVGQIVTGWGDVYTYSGKLMENIVQAISRDILAYGMQLADNMGAKIVLHVHDEIGCESDANDPFAFNLNDLQWCMSQTPDWAPGLLLRAEGYEEKHYKK